MHSSLIHPHIHISNAVKGSLLRTLELSADKEQAILVNLLIKSLGHETRTHKNKNLRILTARAIVCLSIH